MVVSLEQGARALACCKAIRDELERRLPTPKMIFFGPARESGGDPVLARLRARGAHFYWVAVPLGGVVFWDAHFGIVVDPAALTGSAGIHRSRGSTEAARLFARRAPLFRAYRLEHVTSETADEEQWNGAPCDISTASAAAQACRELVVLLEAAEDKLARPGGPEQSASPRNSGG